MDSAKAALRRVMKARIAALDAAAYDKAAGEDIARRLTAHPAWAAADSVFCYVGRRGEIDTRPLLRAALEAGKTLAVPLCMGPGMMQARAVRSLRRRGITAFRSRLPVRRRCLRSDWRCACCPALPPRRMERAWAMAAGITTAFCRWHATQ